MSYEKYYPGGWQSGESGGTPITPEALNHIENGIENAISKDGTVPMTGPLAMGGNKVTGLGDPTEDGDAVSLGYANGAYALASNLSSLKTCFLAIPAASSVKFSVDSHLLMVGRMQVAECTSPAVYAISAYSAIRAPVVAELSAGTYITVATGGDNTDGWYIEVSNTRASGAVSLYFIGSTVPTVLS